MPPNNEQTDSQTDPDTAPTADLILCADSLRFNSSNAGTDAEAIPKFEITAYTGGELQIEGWRGPVVVDLAGIELPETIPVLARHDQGQPIGHGRPRIEANELFVSGVVSVMDSPRAREFVSAGRHGFPWQASIGAKPLEVRLRKKGETFEANGRTFTPGKGGIYHVTKSRLKEVSVLPLGADENSSAAIAAGQTPPPASTSQEIKTMATETKDKQQTRDTPDKQTDPPVAPEPQEQHRHDPPPAPPARAEDEIRAEAVDTERKRIAQIEAACNGLEGEKADALRARAVAGEIDVPALQAGLLDILRSDRPRPPAIHEGGQAVTPHVLEAAALMTGGIRGDDLLGGYGEQAVDAAARRFRGGIGLQELLLEAAWANGYTGRNFRDSRAVLRAAFGPDIQAAFSTVDIGGILSNVANKFLLDGFFSVERTWRNICAVRNVSDFKTVTSYRLIGADQYEPVAPGGELKHGTLGEESYANKADTYGLVLSVDRRDIINDDLGAITTVPRKLGRGSGLKINDVFWAVFLDNSGFFKTANKNYVTGADTALSIDGLTKAETKFMDQVDPDGKPIGIMPVVALVPTALSAIGTGLFKSLEIRDTTADTKYPIANPHQGKFRTEVSRYLSNSQYTGNSAKAWYLLADPNDLPVIEVAFLNGQESPTIETAEADFNVLGIQMRGYHDFGVALQDPKGGIKAKGEA